MEDLEVRLVRLEERVDGMREAAQVSKEDVARRLGDMNELRQQIENERGSFVTSVRYEERHEDMVRRINAVENRLSNIEGGTTIKAQTIGWLLAGFGLAITVVVVVVNFLTQ